MQAGAARRSQKLPTVVQEIGSFLRGGRADDDHDAKSRLPATRSPGCTTRSPSSRAALALVAAGGRAEPRRRDRRRRQGQPGPHHRSTSSTAMAPAIGISRTTCARCASSIARAQDDIHSLRQSRDELERRILADAGARAPGPQRDRPPLRRHRAPDRGLARALTAARRAQPAQPRGRGAAGDAPRGARSAARGRGRRCSRASRRTISRIDQELQRLSGVVAGAAARGRRAARALEQRPRGAAAPRDRDRSRSRAETNRITRIDDRLELVQAERTRHNERLNEIAAELHEDRCPPQRARRAHQPSSKRASASYQDDAAQRCKERLAARPRADLASATCIGLQRDARRTCASARSSPWRKRYGTCAAVPRLCRRVATPAPGVLERYAEFLPLTGATPRIDLGEGSTPLVHVAHIGPSLGHRASSTSSSRAATRPARSRTAAWSSPSPRRWRRARKAVLCASTGNTSASAAAYAAHCGLECYVFLPKGGNVAPGKLAQSVAYGAQIVAIDGSFDDALRLAREYSERHPVALVNSVNPHRIAGPEDGRVRDRRRAGRRAGRAVHPGGQRRQHHGLLGRLHGVRRPRATRTKLPRMMGFQAAGAAPIVADQHRRRPADRSRRRSASATRRAGAAPTPRATSPAAPSTASRTTRSSRPTTAWRAKKASSANRPRRPASPA